MQIEASQTDMIQKLKNVQKMFSCLSKTGYKNTSQKKIDKPFRILKNLNWRQKILAPTHPQYVQGSKKSKPVMGHGFKVG